MPDHQSDSAAALASLPAELLEDVDLTGRVAMALGLLNGASLSAAAALVIAYRARTNG